MFRTYEALHRQQRHQKNMKTTGGLVTPAVEAFPDDPFTVPKQTKEHGQEFSLYSDLDLWKNRLIVHNPTAVVTQWVRDILLRYYYSSRTRKLLECGSSCQ